MFSKVENKSQWRSLLNRALFKTFFHTSEWEDFLEKEFSWIKFERYIWKDELLLSVARCKLFGKEKIVSHPFCEYGGPLPLVESVEYASFEQDFVKKFGRNARMRFHPKIKEGGGMDLSTFWIEDYSKKTVDELWRGLRKTFRQEIKNSEKLGVYIEDCQNEEELKRFYDLYFKTVKRHKNIPLPFSIFQFLFKDISNASILLAKKDSKVLGGSIFLFYKPFIHYFLSASDYSVREYNTVHAILWSAIRGYKDREGYDYFDLGGTRRGSALETFKRGWGVREYSIYEIGYYKRKSGASPLRNILGLLPGPIMTRMAKYALWLKI